MDLVLAQVFLYNLLGLMPLLWNTNWITNSVSVCTLLPHNTCGIVFTVQLFTYDICRDNHFNFLHSNQILPQQGL